MTQGIILEEKQRKTISVLRALPISDSTIVAAKFLVQSCLVLLAFLIFYFGSIFLTEQLRGLRLGKHLGVPGTLEQGAWHLRG